LTGRSISELQHILDPDEELKRKKASSYLKALINKAAQEGLLEDARPLLGRKNSPHWAEEIIDAGNWAVHKLNKFNQRYGGDQGSNRLHDLLTITRKALIQLLSEKKG